MIGLNQSAGVSLKSRIFQDALASRNSDNTSAPTLNTSQIINETQTKFSRFGPAEQKQAAREQQEAQPQKPMPVLDSNGDGKIDKFEAASVLNDPRVKGTELEKIALKLLKQQQFMNKQMDGNLGVNRYAPPPMAILGFQGMA